ncbi:hypothetical protein H0A36_06305 [Endozoicomonas sp. SM1973]|uniref:Uncharacterized protein n=1 Tax=Spartinivicinus marinus TaxID=2994442 RepID=A0A853I4H8_9GAMM|nr:hypothetical protein [Spartinivicinus marinus]MCX4028283.1 hypothetical protein [Spartinivicinus marinus]NYZ65618.1 hypothetical protein [Spartinivicinus marinus]
MKNQQALAEPTAQDVNTGQTLVATEEILLQTIPSQIIPSQLVTNSVEQVEGSKGSEHKEGQRLLGDSKSHAILDSTVLDLESVQQALLQGGDPTAMLAATAAGNPNSNQVSNVDEGSEGSVNIRFIDRDGHETIASSGFDTEEVSIGLQRFYSDEAPERIFLKNIVSTNNVLSTGTNTTGIDSNTTDIVSNKTGDIDIDDIDSGTIGSRQPNVSQHPEPSPEPSVEPEPEQPTPQPKPIPEPSFTTPTISLSSVVSKSLFFTNFDIEGFKPVMGTFVDSLDGWLPKSGEKIEAWREYEEGEIPNLYGFGKYSAHSGTNFIELNSAQPASGPYPAFANFADVTSATEINRVINTQEGGIYEFSFYYSARPFFNESVTEIEVLWNNEVIKTIALDGTNLKDTDWQLFKYTMIGDGEPATVTIRHTGDPSVQGRGAFLDDLQITEITGGGVVAGYENTVIDLPDFAIEYAHPSDKDDVLVWLRGLPQGAILSDGVHQLEISDNEIDITDWNHQSMTIKLTNDFVSNHSDANKVDIDLKIDIVKKTDQTSVTQQALRVVVLEENHYETSVDNYLIAGSGQDIFIFGQDDRSNTDTPEVDVIVGFNAEQDVLNIDDLLVGLDDSIDQYLDINFNSGGTEIDISLSANDDIDQKIVLKDVKLDEVYGTTNEVDIINHLFSNQLDALIA